VATVDIEAYLRRIGHAGPCRVDRQTLESLIARHAAAIPFENFEVLAGRVPSLELPALQRKMLGGLRGGYCFEQNLLFLAVLREIGFEAQRLEARVRANVPPDVVTGRTHLTVRVELDGESLLADVGFGGLAPLAPVPFDGRPRQCPDGAVYRVVPHGDGAALQIDTEHGWDDCYIVGPGTPEGIDLEMGNWYVATHPAAMLGKNLLVARAVDGGRLTLFNQLLSFRRITTGTIDQRTLATPAEFDEVLRGRFGLCIDAADLGSALARVMPRVG
jgi:N-hydroxyarylamine O-acetyltransferase